MKRFTTILLLLLLVVFITGCNNKTDDINYMELIDVPSLIEIDIENVPDDLNSFVTIVDEILVNKVTVDTSMVDFDNPGDYSIEIIVDYSDGVTKKFNSVLRLSFNNVIGVPVILGVKNRLISPTEDTIDFLDGVAFSDDKKIIDSGVIGTVNLDIEGIYTLIYYAEDDDGNYVTTSSFIVVAKNLYFYDTFVNNLYELNGEETKYLRAYSILYSAIHAASDENKESIGYFGNFLTTENFEAILNRPLRKDESNAITEAQKIFRKNDVLTYQDYYGVTFTNNEKELFERAYEIYVDFASKTAVSDVTNDFYIAHTAYSQLYSYKSTTLNTFDQEALDFYSNLTKLSLDSIYLTIVNETRYEFDERILDIDFISNYTHIIDDINDEGLFIDEELFKQSYGLNEQLFLDIYLEYYHYKTLYKMTNHLLELGYLEANTYTLEEAYIFLKDIVQSDTSHSNLIAMNIIDINDLETILDRPLTIIEKSKINLFIVAYDDFFITPYSWIFELYEPYLTEQEKQYVKDAYTLFNGYNQNTQIFLETYLTLEKILGRAPTDYELDTLDFVRFLNPNPVLINSNRNNIHILYKYIYKYQINKDVLYGYLEDYSNLNVQDINYNNPNYENIKIEGYLEYVNIFETYYGAMDLGELSSLTKLFDLFSDNEIESFVFERLIISNNINIVEDNYEISFTNDEKKIINNYIIWISNKIREEAENEKQNPDYKYYLDDEYLEAFQTVITEAFPCVFILDDGYTFFNKHTFERVTGKEMTESLEDALTLLGTKDSLSELEALFFDQGIDPNSINDLNRAHFISIYKLYEKDILYNFEYQFRNFTLSSLTSEESAAFEYFYLVHVTEENIVMRDIAVANFRRVGLNSYIPSYLRVVDLLNENAIIMNNYNGELTTLAEITTDTEDLAHIENTRKVQKYFKYYSRYLEKLDIPGNTMPSTADAGYAIEFLLANGFAINSSIEYYMNLKENIADYPVLYDLSRENITRIWSYIDALQYLSITNLANSYYIDTSDISSEFEQVKTDAFLKMHSLGYNLNDTQEILNNASNLSFTDDELTIIEIINSGYQDDTFHFYVLIGMSYLNESNENIALEDLMIFFNAIQEIPLEELYLHIPSTMSEQERQKLYTQLYPDQVYVEYSNTIYAQEVLLLVDRITAFNERFMNDEATVDEYQNLQGTIHRLFDISGYGAMRVIHPYFIDDDLVLTNIPGFMDAIIPLIYASDMCPNGYFNPSSSYSYDYISLQIYPNQYGILDCYTDMLLNNLLVVDINEVVIDTIETPVYYEVIIEYFSFQNYRTISTLEAQLGKEIPVKFYDILDKNYREAELRVLELASYSNNLTLHEQRKVLELHEFVHQLYINGYDVNDYIESSFVHDQFSNLLTPEMEKIVMKILWYKNNFEIRYTY